LDDSESNPAVLRKRKEIEDALSLQRARKQQQQSACGASSSSSSSSSHPMDVEEESDRAGSSAAAAVREIPGYYYDIAKNRYFKLNKAIATARRDQQRQRPPVQASAGLREQDSLLARLGRRALGLRVGAADLAAALAGRVRAQAVPPPPLAVAVSDAMSFHPVFGLAVTAGPTSLQFISSVLPPHSPLQCSRGPKVLSLHWSPSMSFPMLGCIKQSASADRIEIYRLDASSGYTSGRPQVMEGVLPSGHQKEIFQSMEWSGDGEAVYTGGDIGLWRHDLGGRRGRHLVLDGVSIITVIQPPRRRGEGGGRCVTMGLRTGGVVEVDERDRDRRGRPLASMMRAIDHIHTLRDGNTMVCQDITNNILLYDVRVPGVSVHTIRGSAESSTPRGFSYYEGEAPVRSRKFWVSPRHELLAVSDGQRGGEAIVLIDPRRPAGAGAGAGSRTRSNVVHTIKAGAVRTSSAAAAGVYGNNPYNHSMAAASNSNAAINGIRDDSSTPNSGYWKLVTNGAHWDDSDTTFYDNNTMLRNCAVGEWAGCYGLSIANSASDAGNRGIISTASCIRLTDTE
jgi:hypothetical protein